MPNVPVRLDRPPLVEAVLEVRFAPTKESVGELLPGLLYGKLKLELTRFRGHVILGRGGVHHVEV